MVILRAGCSYRQRLEELLARRGVVGLRRLEFGTLEAILGAVSADLGVTLMPAALAGKTWRGGRIAVHRPQGGDTAVVLSVIDNLTKGAAGQAVQNMNLMCGFAETTGLEQVPLMP